jgi:hypothetical protein
VGRLLTLTTLLALASGVEARAGSQQFDLSLDVRAVAVRTGQQSYLHGGGGSLRFDEQHQGLQLGSLRLGYRGDISDTVRLSADAYAYADNNGKPMDLTELNLAWRPFPVSPSRHELRVGAFYAPISLEHRMSGWRTPYSLTPSAINSWVGEELRTIGASYSYDWLGQQQGKAFNLGLTGALFGYNDPAGVLLALRGWALHDRQTTLFGSLGRGDTGIIGTRRLVYPDIDHRPGYYAGASANYRGTLELRALHYDNRGDPTATAPQIQDGAWKTVFDSFGARYTPSDSWTFLWQRLSGHTAIGADFPPNRWQFQAGYLLASWLHGAQRVSGRIDAFSMHQTVSDYGFYNENQGHAAMLAWSYAFNSRLTLTAEALRVQSELASRAWIAAPLAAVERQLQLALRLEL